MAKKSNKPAAEPAKIETPKIETSTEQPAEQPAEPVAADVTEAVTTEATAPTPEPAQVPEAVAAVAPAGDIPADIPAEAAAPAPTIDTVLRELAGAPAVAPGYRSRTPETKLTAEQAELQMELYQVLQNQGLKLRRPGDVYGWLLDQIAASLSR